MRTWRTKALWAAAALLAVNAVLLGAQFAGAVPRGLGQYFFGPKLVRMEVVVKDGGAVRVYRVDRGRVKGIRPALSGITLLERDGTVAVVPVAPDADVTLGGRTVTLASLRRGMTVTTVREGDAPAELVQAARR